MTQTPPDPKPPSPALTDRARAERDARIARQAEALRANLRRRKDQQRERTTTEGDPPIRD